jgi:hypothetical protein
VLDIYSETVTHAGMPGSESNDGINVERSVNAASDKDLIRFANGFSIKS